MPISKVAMQKLKKLPLKMDKTANAAPPALASAPAINTGFLPYCRIKYDAGIVEISEPSAKHDKGKVAQLLSGAIVKPTIPAVANTMMVMLEYND